jgi:hypothetical protein
MNMTLAREWMRGAAPLAVLTLLERDEMYGYQLVEALEKDSGGLLAMGQSTVYPRVLAILSRRDAASHELVPRQQPETGENMGGGGCHQWNCGTKCAGQLGDSAGRPDSQPS